MFWLAIAAQVAAPKPDNYNSWWSPGDMPRSVMEAGVTRKVLTRTTIAPDGSILRCDIEGPSGDPKLDLITCAIIVKRGKFQPAQGIDGLNTYGVYRQTVTWAVLPVGETADSSAQADLELHVAALPAGIKSPATVRLMFAVDTTGRPSNCAPEITPSIPEINWKLAPIACAQLMKNYTAIAVRDAKGVIRPSVQDAAVTFLTSR